MQISLVREFIDSGLVNLKYIANVLTNVLPKPKIFIHSLLMRLIEDNVSEGVLETLVLNILCGICCMFVLKKYF